MCVVLKELKGWRQVRDFFAWMKLQLSYCPSVIVYTIVLRLYGQVGKLNLAEEVFLEMLDAACEPDEVACGTMLWLMRSSYGKLGLYKDACKTFENIKRLGLLTNKKTYLAMAQVHLTSGNVDKALEVIGLMKSSNLWFSRFAYIVLLQCYVMKEDVVSAEGTFLALRKTGPPDAGCCNDMLNMYVGLNLMNKAKGFIVRIRKDKTLFDEELYRTVMKVYCKEGMLPEAELLTNQMVNNESFKNRKFFETFYWILCEHKGDVQSDDKLMAIEPMDKVDITVLGISLYLTNDSFSKTKILLKLLLGCAGGSKIVSQFSISLIKDGQISKAESLNHQLITLGYRMEVVTVASLISHYGKQHMLKHAEDIFAEYVNCPTSNKLLYNSMIDAYAKCGKQEKAYLLYKQATDEGHDLGVLAKQQ